ncbi:MAG: molybdopterin oxidoreductase family protein [Rhodospirillales bacterium]|nr:molybdopterin oxidoreductase family protein [Rhodospirillales bacterium]MDH3792341.1 molybdopterin oxidoreductase family protein [Rhodospirillales bacterium]MDH3967094.1 molybdopterin oxidoreductase family protein [Rhodospirillales bacterium]
MPLDSNSKPQTAHSACPHDCPSTCALEVERLGAMRIGRVRGARDNPYTDGVICAKVARYAERVHHPERLTTPLKRIGEKGGGRASFQAISWEAALDEVAEALLKAEQSHGPETVWPYYFAGTMGHVQRDGIQRLRHVMGYSRQHSTICTTLPESGWLAGVGAKAGVDAREIAQSDLIVVWGGNPVSTQVNVMTHIAKARKAQNAKLVVVDPYRTGTAEQADLHLMVKPGTDGALAAAVIHVLLKEGFADRAYLAQYTDWDAAAEAHFADKTPKWAAAITGIDAGEIQDFARLYGGTKRSFVRVGYGFARGRNGASNLHAVSCLPAVTGAWANEGGGALWGNGEIYHLDKTLIEGLDRLDKSVRALDQSRLGPVLTGDKRDLGEGPPVTALFVQNTNPAVVCPETKRCLEGLSRADLFTCVHEQFMTETAALADIVLPATTFLEHDDYYTASGHTFLQATKPVIEPLPECRSNHEVICALAKRLGAEHPGFEMSAWELIEATFQASGHPPAEAVWRARWLDCAEPFEKAHFLDGFAQPGGRFRFHADWAGVGRDHAGMPALADHWESIDTADPAHPFRLVAAPARGYLNTSFTETPGSRRREGRPEIMVHPETCRRLGLGAGARVRVGNELGSLVLHLRPFDGVLPEVVVVESIWPNAAFEEGLGINTLVSADPGAPRGGAVFHDTAVWLRPA